MSGKKTIDVVAGIIILDNKILLCQRSQKTMHPLQWEFPGGKTKTGENPETALRRELAEELDINVVKSTFLLQHTHFYDTYQLEVNLNFYRVETTESVFHNNQFADIRLVELDKVDNFDLLAADKTCWPVLKQKIRNQSH